jgi:hypothetical protein
MLLPVQSSNGVSRRRAVRRAVSLDCEITSDQWEGEVVFRATDLSHLGLWVETQFPLDVGEEVIVSLTPPRWPRKNHLVALALVARVGLFRRQSDCRDSGMGLSFVDLESGEARELAGSLRGMPPPLPRALPMTRAVAKPEEVIPRAPSHEEEVSGLVLPDGSLACFRAEGRLLTGVRRSPVPRLRLVSSNGRIAQGVNLRPYPRLRLAA